MYHLLKFFLFLLSPETAHHFTFRSLKAVLRLPGTRRVLAKTYRLNDHRLEKNIAGLRFKNPVGLAAGLDKDAQYFNELSCFGFGFIETGTITPLPQPGNDRPRLFR